MANTKRGKRLNGSWRVLVDANEANAGNEYGIYFDEKGKAVHIEAFSFDGTSMPVVPRGTIYAFSQFTRYDESSNELRVNAYQIDVSDSGKISKLRTVDATYKVHAHEMEGEGVFIEYTPTKSTSDKILEHGLNTSFPLDVPTADITNMGRDDGLLRNKDGSFHKAEKRLIESLHFPAFHAGRRPWAARMQIDLDNPPPSIVAEFNAARVKEFKVKVALARKVEEELPNRVLYQDASIGKIVKLVKQKTLGLSGRKQPIMILLLGPTGVGKSETAVVLADLLCDGALRKFDMSEYMEGKHAVSRLIGAPPGYVGYDTGGALTKAVAAKPRIVLQFDEAEKAHPDIHNVFLGLKDTGILVDKDGNDVDFSETVLVFTTNISAADAQEMRRKGTTRRVGFGNNTGSPEALQAAIEEIYREGLKKYFSPELLNRFDEILIYDTLPRPAIRMIVGREVEKVSDTLENLPVDGVTLDVSPAVMDQLAEEGYNPLENARAAQRIVRRMIGQPLNDWLTEPFSPETPQFTNMDNIIAQVTRRGEVRLVVDTLEGPFRPRMAFPPPVQPANTNADKWPALMPRKK